MLSSSYGGNRTCRRLDFTLTGVTYPSTCPAKVFLMWAQYLFSSFTMSFQCGSDTTRPLSCTESSAGEVWTERGTREDMSVTDDTGEAAAVKAGRKTRTWGGSWSYSPRPPLCAASSRQFSKVSRRPDSSMRRRAAAQTWLSSPNQKRSRGAVGLERVGAG